MAPPQRRRRAQADQRPDYREAAEMAIGQLDWCIDYLRRIDKPKLARALEHNRDTIVSRAQRAISTAQR